MTMMAPPPARQAMRFGLRIAGGYLLIMLGGLLLVRLLRTMLDCRAAGGIELSCTLFGVYVGSAPGYCRVCGNHDPVCLASGGAGLCNFVHARGCGLVAWAHQETAMSKFALAIAMTLASVPAFACPLSQSLAAHYGISFSGFRVAIPETRAPDTANGDAFVRVMVPDDSHVSDGFRHTLVMNAKSKKVWILRTSGFASVYQWFGPVDAVDPSLTKCRLEPNPVVLKSK